MEAASPSGTLYGAPTAMKSSPTIVQMYGPASSNNHPYEQNHTSAHKVEDDSNAEVVAANGQAAPNSAPSTNDSSIPPKPKKRKATTTAPKDSKNAAEPKEKKERKPRDPNKPPVKRRKLADANGAAEGHEKPKRAPELMPAAAPHQAIIPSATTMPAQPSAQTGNFEAKDIAVVKGVNGGGVPQTRKPASGQRYDPIRGIATPEQPRHTDKPASPVVPSHAVRSPSSMAHLLSPTLPSSDLTSRLQTASDPSVRQPTSTSAAAKTATKTTTDSMIIDERPAPAPRARKSNSPKNAASPKPLRAKEPAPPPPLGSGLLSNAAFGRPEEKPKQYAEVPNQCIVIDVPMHAGKGGYVNFMKEVEQKYGFDVAHPRLAEHKRRMDQIAAAGAAIESGPGSADEMIVDGSDAESNAEMGGMEEGSAVEGEKKKTTRAKKKDEYNKDDDFIDDTEMMWEEQALASKDGYFVWSGPLVPEGDKPTVERADGTVKRGRGSRGRGGPTRGETTARGRGTGAGRGSRGGATVRKPRVTKADRARMETEKAERERMGVMAAAPSQYPGTS